MATQERKRCPACSREFVVRSGQTRCGWCAGLGSRQFVNHRLEVVANEVGAEVLVNVTAALKAEGFTITPPGRLAVPADWLLGLIKIVDDMGPDPNAGSDLNRLAAWARITAHVDVARSHRPGV